MNFMLFCTRVASSCTCVALVLSRVVSGCTRVAVCRVKNFLEMLGLLVQFSQKKLILIKKVLQLRQNEHLFKAYFENVIIQL